MDRKYDNKVYYNNGGGDEKLTPPGAVRLLLPYIQHLKGKIIWCPFDKENSEFVKVLSENGFEVVYSHIEDGQDFFEYEPEKWDVIISNPPYKGKRKFLERALSFRKPFALLLPVNILSDAVINQIMKGREDEFQLLIPSHRIRFRNREDGLIGTQPTFKAAYFGVGLFSKQLILTKYEVEK